MKKSIRARAFAPALSVLSLAVVASLQVLKAILESGKRLADIKAGMTKLPQVLINVRLTSGSADSILAKDSVKQAVLTAEEVLGDEGRVLLRKSGTEPLIRVMVESTDIALTQQKVKNAKKL